MADLESFSIVLVDQSDYLSERLGERLSASEIEIHQANSAADCLDIIEANEVQGIVSRHSLPDMDGITLLRSVRVTRPNTPFILVPENGSETLASEAIDAGVSRYIANDDDAETVVSRIADAYQETTPWADEKLGPRYRHLVEVSPVPINLFDRTGKSIWCNTATLDLLGLDSREDIIGKSILEFIHPDDQDLAEEEIERVTRQKESVGPTQMKLRRIDGGVKYIYVSTAIGRFLDEDIGQAIAVDITELRDVREELQREQTFIDTALDALEDIFYVLNDQGELLRWNETATRVTGVTEEEMAGKQVTEFFVEEDKDRIADSISSIIETGNDTVEARLVNRDGQHVPYEFRGQRLSDSVGSDGGRVVGIGRDMTVRKEREHQLRNLGRWLRHNIRNDLTVIQGSAELIRNAEGPGREELTDQILAKADHLVTQADKQKDIIDIVTESPSLTQLSVRELVERQVNSCRERHPNAEIELGEMDDFRAETTPLLNSAIAELLDNAVEHDDSEPERVRVEVTAGGETGTIRIADTGPGIPQMEREELFIDRDIDQIHHGSGLGLLFVHWVVRHSGGQLSISENSPRGSIVEITLSAV
jgi:PAS domain S-box-containing protein